MQGKSIAIKQLFYFSHVYTHIRTRMGYKKQYQYDCLLQHKQNNMKATISSRTLEAPIEMETATCYSASAVGGESEAHSLAQKKKCISSFHLELLSPI